MHVINLENIRSIAESVDMVPIIKRITPPRALRIPARPQAFPPLDRPLQQGYDWWKFRGEPRVTKTQALLYAIAKSTRAWNICVVGIGWGAELYAIARGSYDAGYTEITSNGYDDGLACPGSLEWVRECLMADRMAYNLSYSTMPQYEASGLPISHIDLFKLDAEYSGSRLPADIGLALKTLSAKGILVITSAYAGMPTPAEMIGPAGESMQALLMPAPDVWIYCRETQVPK